MKFKYIPKGDYKVGDKVGDYTINCPTTWGNWYASNKDHQTIILIPTDEEPIYEKTEF